MPNYCDNLLNIKGSKENIIKFLNDFTVTDNNISTFSMNRIIPEPASPDVDTNYNWYDWRLENWGCKWDIGLSIDVTEVFDNITEINNDIEIYSIDIPYTTPWGPNLEFLQLASKKYPLLIFNTKYYEPGCELGGEITFTNGSAHNIYENRGHNDFEYYKWAIDNDFEDVDFLLDEMDFENSSKDIYDKLKNHYRPSDENILDFSDILLGNNIPKPE